jgi:hypothetical protein
MSRTPPQRASAPSAAPAAGLANLHLAMLSRTTGAMVRATGELQQQMARRAGLLQQEAARQLHQATNPAELMTLQTALVMAGWQHSLQCTQDLANAWLALGTAGAQPARDDARLH